MNNIRRRTFIIVLCIALNWSPQICSAQSEAAKVTIAAKLTWIDLELADTAIALTFTADESGESWFEHGHLRSSDLDKYWGIRLLTPKSGSELVNFIFSDHEGETRKMFIPIDHSSLVVDSIYNPPSLRFYDTALLYSEFLYGLSVSDSIDVQEIWEKGNVLVIENVNIRNDYQYTFYTKGKVYTTNIDLDENGEFQVISETSTFLKAKRRTKIEAKLKTQPELVSPFICMGLYPGWMLIANGKCYLISRDCKHYNGNSASLKYAKTIFR